MQSSHILELQGCCELPQTPNPIQAHISPLPPLLSWLTEMGTQARLQSTCHAPEEKTSQVKNGDVPDFSTAKVPASGFTEHLASDLVSHHLVNSDRILQSWWPLPEQARVRPRLPGHWAKSTQKVRGNVYNS